MLLPFPEVAANRLVRTWKFDPEVADLADRHYSRQKIGSNQFMPPGKTLILRNAQGTIVFAWSWQMIRDDGQKGYNCTIFRNESPRLSSDIILEAERAAVSHWGPNRAFTFIDAGKISSRNPGYCFKRAGWKVTDRSKVHGRILLEKYLG